MSLEQVGQALFQYVISDHPEIIAGVAAAIGLGFAARILVHQQKQDQVKLIESVFKDVRDLQREYAEEKRKPQTADIYGMDFDSFSRDWDSRFFNTLEWLSFLINSRHVKDKKLINYFRPSIIAWYDEVFAKHASADVINDPTQYEEFKKLYRKLKRQSNRRFWRMKYENHESNNDSQSPTPPGSSNGPAFPSPAQREVVLILVGVFFGMFASTLYELIYALVADQTKVWAVSEASSLSTLIVFLAFILLFRKVLARKTPK